VANGKLGDFKGFQSKTKSAGRSIAQFILANLTRLVPEEQFEKQFIDLLHVAQKPTYMLPDGENEYYDYLR
jgi:hypothetical protein